MLAPTIPSDQSPQQLPSSSSSRLKLADNLLQPLRVDANSAIMPTNLDTSSISRPIQSHTIFSSSAFDPDSSPRTSLRNTFADLPSYTPEDLEARRLVPNLSHPTHRPSRGLRYGEFLDSMLFPETFHAPLQQERTVFLDKKLLFWFELLSLRKSVNRAAPLGAVVRLYDVSLVVLPHVFTFQLNSRLL